MWIERVISDAIREAGSKFPVLLLAGIRKTGKTALLKTIFPQVKHISIDTPARVLQISEDPMGFFNELTAPCVLDQIQYAPAILEALDSQISQSSPATITPWILTSTHISPSIQSYLEQFSSPIKLFSLSTLSAQELRSTWISSNERIQYCWKGGFPELWAEPSLEIGRFFDSYLHLFLERDLKGLVQVKNSLEFQRFLRLCAQTAGSIVNYTKISRNSGVSANTVKAWIASLHETGIIRLLPCYPGLRQKRLVKAPKLYFSDVGLLCYLLGISSQKALSSHPQKEEIWQNVVFGELEKSGNWIPGSNLFYYRDQNGVEIDFILSSKNRISLIHSAYAAPPASELSSFSTVKRAFSNRRVQSFAASAAADSTLTQEQGYRVYNPLYQELPE